MRKQNIIWGLLFLLAAVLIIMNEFGFLGDISILGIVISVIMVGILIVSVRAINFWGIFFPLAIILIVNAEAFNATNVTPWPVLMIALLLSLGLSLLFNRHGFSFIHLNSDTNFSDRFVFEQDSNVIKCSTTFGDCIKYVNTENLEKAYIKCSFGDIKLYFDNAMIPSGHADIYLDVSFGDVVLYIPRAWKVTSDAHLFFADLNIKHNTIESEGPTVTLHGNINFGDTVIKYV